MPILWNAGLQQQTPAVQAAYRGLMKGRSAAKRRKKKAAAPKRRAKKSKSERKWKKVAGKAARFVKGSAAAKRYMAKLRKMVKRK